MDTGYGYGITPQPIQAPVKQGPKRIRNYWFIVTSILAGISLVLGVVGLATTNWFEITVTSGVSPATKSVTTEIGIFRSCTSGNCQDYTYSDFKCVATSQVRSGSDLKNRMNGITAMIIIGIVLSTILIVTSAFSYKYMSRWLWIVSVLLVLFATFTYGCGVIVFSYTFDDWYNCEHEFCAGIAGCSEKYGYSFALTSAALGVSFLTIWIVLLGNRVANAAPKQVAQIRAMGGAPAGPPSRHNSLPRFPSQQPASMARPPSPRAASPVMGPSASRPPSPRQGVAGDEEWRFDPTSGMYWSELQKLYLDTASNQYYDPSSEQWYNPATGQWAFAS
jgi:hypothetical protein